MPLDDVPVQVRVPHNEIEEIDALIKQGRYKNRAEFFRIAGLLLRREEIGNNHQEQGVGVEP